MGLIGGQTKLSEFLRYGAAGSSGTVIEPLATPQKFPHPFVHVHYARGCSLAESFYQSIYGPFQTLIVGDALCQPFATPPLATVTGITPGGTVAGKKKLSFDTSRSPVRVKFMELFIDGRRDKIDRSLDAIDVPTSVLSDGYHEIRVVFVAANRAETTSRTVIPFFVNNKDQACSLEVDQTEVNLDDTIPISFSSEGATAIRVVQNRRVICRMESDSGTARIKATDVGRGPVRLQAIATHGESEVASEPVEITVSGAIATDRPMTTKGKK